MINLLDIGYVAGLLEGEGSFGYHKAPTIQIRMTDAEPIHKLKNIMAPFCIVTKQFGQFGHKNQYCLQFGGILAIEWMMTIYTLMSPRRKERIRLVIRKWKAANSGKVHKLSIINRMKNYA